MGSCKKTIDGQRPYACPYHRRATRNAFLCDIFDGAINVFAAMLVAYWYSKFVLNQVRLIQAKYLCAAHSFDNSLQSTYGHRIKVVQTICRSPLARHRRTTLTGDTHDGWPRVNGVNRSWSIRPSPLTCRGTTFQSGFQAAKMIRSAVERDAKLSRPSNKAEQLRVRTVLRNNCDGATRTVASRATSQSAPPVVYDEHFTLKDGNVKPLPETLYTVILPSGVWRHGTTDGQGKTARYTTDAARNVVVYLGHRAKV